MDEYQLQCGLVERLQEGQKNPLALQSIEITESTGGLHSLYNLIQTHPFEVIMDNTDWSKGQLTISRDVIGGMVPDVVLRSVESRQNRIIIEVKFTRALAKGLADSQVLRYFLHLLCTTDEKPNNKEDIRRALLLAAPLAWFEETRTGNSWRYFVDRYKDLADAFRITLGRLVLD